MTRHVRLGELVFGVEGIALMRHLLDEEGSAEERIEEIRGIARGDDDVYQLGLDVPTVDFRSGYAQWAETYDRPGNPLISVEEPVVWQLLDAKPAGDALDAACGTGRHTRHLVDRGYTVVGVDGTPEMLAKARSAVPEADFREGDLARLPLDDASVDLALCALALEHVENLEPVVAELARVVRPGGSIVLSDLHPTLGAAFGGGAFFQDAAGGAARVRGYCHLHSDYLRAFTAAGLTINHCLEPRFSTAEAAMQLAASFVPGAAQEAFVGLPGALIWELTRP